MAINSIGSGYQIIQNPVNLQRLEQQNQLPAPKQNVTDSKVADVSSSYKEKSSNASSSDYESMKGQYGSLMDSKNSKIAAYKSVLNQDARENISSKLGISVYA